MQEHVEPCFDIPSIRRPDRRGVIASGLATAACAIAARSLPAEASGQLSLPAEVAGISIPRSRLATKAALFSRAVCPDYLFNHCMRTFLFGALYVQRKTLLCDVETAFIAAAMHDLGLLPKFASPKASFEVDGADATEKFLKESGASNETADVAWHAVEMHDGKWPLTFRQGAEAMLVAVGAASDVDGPDTDVADEKQIREIVAAFPRLQFKTRFTALLIDHCRRKPTSQRATWLEGLCREQVPSAWGESTEREIANAKFAE